MIEIEERARRYIAKLPPAVAGQSGHDATFRAACVLSVGFSLGESVVKKLLQEWNGTHCSPLWSEKEIEHKVRQAMKSADNAGSERGSLVGQPPSPPPASGVASRTERTARTGEARPKISINVKPSRQRVHSRTSRTLNFTSYIGGRINSKEDIISETPSETSESEKTVSTGLPGDDRAMLPLEVVKEVVRQIEDYRDLVGGEPNVLWGPAEVLLGRAEVLGLRVVARAGPLEVGLEEDL